MSGKSGVKCARMKVSTTQRKPACILPKMTSLMNYTCLFTNITHPHIFNTLPPAQAPLHPMS